MGEDDARFNLLLVDDHPENLVALKAILDDPTYTLFTATSGREALRLALRETFAVILLDAIMPEMDGFEVATNLKALERTRNIPIIFVTAVATDIGQLYRAYDVGALDYLLKPLDPEVVRKKVAVLVDLTRQRREIERQSELLRAAEHREYELRLAELRVANDARYRSLVDGIDKAIAWTMAPAGRLTFVSGQAPKILGYPLDEFLEPDFWISHVFEDDRREFATLLQKATVALPEKDLALNHRMVAADGRVLWFHTGIKPQLSDGPELHGVSVDVSDIKRAEEVARQATGVRDQLLAVVSHDLRNPLNSIILTATSIEEEAQLTDPSGKYLRSVGAILRSARRMEELIEDLLDLSRIDAGGLAVKPEPISAALLVDELVETLKPISESKGLVFEAAADEDVVVLADRKRTLQILRNLLGNAIKFTPRGGTVTLRIRRDGPNARVSVTDTGPGIPESERARVWERFWRAGGREKGVGLGLWIAKGLVEAQSGRIWLESPPEGGATFHFTLPLLAGEPSENAEAAPT